MADARLDRIYIRGLETSCIIGIYPKERDTKQEVVADLVLHADLSKACASDDIQDTIDYKRLKQRILAFVEKSECFLIEHLAERIASICLDDPRIKRVEVVLDKPGALTAANSVAVHVIREQGAR